VIRPSIRSHRVHRGHAFALIFLPLLAPVFCPAQAPPQYIISTVAGNCNTAIANPCPGNYAGDGGPATNAFLSGPSDVVFDPSGNLDISDSLNERIRQVVMPASPNAIISTIVGNGTAGYFGDGSSASGPGTELSGPTGLTFDSHGNLYIGDLDNFVIREVNTSGIISTVAGDNTLGAGFAGDLGPATSAQIDNPTGVAVDSAGNLYIADSSNNVVRVVCADQTPVVCKNLAAGDIDTFAGNYVTGASYSGDGGPAANALLNNPVAVLLDPAGNLYITDNGNNAVRKVNTSGIITTAVGDGTGNAGYLGDGGPATSAELNDPKGLGMDSYGNLYIADHGNSVIRMVAPSGIITTIAGNRTFGYSGDGGPATSAELFFPSGVAAYGGQIFIADNSNNVIRMLTPGKPQIGAGGVITAGDFGASATVAPGSWIEIYGVNLAPGARPWGSADFTGSDAPTALDSVSVTLGGQPAFVAYISAGQVNVQVPLNVAAGPQPLIVTTKFGASASYSLTVGSSPGLYAPPFFSVGGKQYVGALFANSGTWVLPVGAISGFTSQPAAPGDIITLFGIGFGTVSPSVPAGVLDPGLATLTSPVQVMFGSTAATLQYQGLSPGSVGLYQLNVVVPQVAAGSAVPLTITQGGVPLAQTLYTAVAAAP
jgi:uncharacterized protein (TIGR03437 family)